MSIFYTIQAILVLYWNIQVFMMEIFRRTYG